MRDRATDVVVFRDYYYVWSSLLKAYVRTYIPFNRQQRKEVREFLKTVDEPTLLE